MPRRALWFAAVPLALVGLAHGGCGSGDKLAAAHGDPYQSPEGGAGGAFDPGKGGPVGTGGCGYGASPGSGASCSGSAGGNANAGDAGKDAQDEPQPPMCADDLKRCDHVFSLADGGEKSVEVRGDFAAGAWMSGVPMTKSGGVWMASVPVPFGKPVAYKFYVDGTTWKTDPQNPKTMSDGAGGLNSVLDAQTCAFWSCDVPSGTYDWRDAVMYFAFVDRFVDGDPTNNGAPVTSVDPAANYQGGDWKGLLSKIDDGYFTELGVNTLWITVPLDNPESAGLGTDNKQYSAYHGYWPVDLSKTEERFGTLADLKALVDGAHAKNIRVLLDYAMHHVYKTSTVYTQHPDWFWPPGTCICGDPGCSFDDPVLSKQCWFRDYLPTFNFNVGAARDFSVSNAIQWVKDSGADGFRLDAVKQIETAWVTDLRARAKTELEPISKQHFYMVGETFTGDKGLIKSYVDPSAKLDGQFDFPMRVQVVSTVLMRQGAMSDLEGFLAANDGYYGSGVMSTFLGNHDIPRAIHFAEDTPLWKDPWDGGKDKNWSNQPALPAGTSAFERLASAFTILFTNKGIPLIYYGDEIGMPGAGDPDNRRMMQLSGYSQGQTALLAHVKKLTAVRAAHPALRKGNRKPLSATNDTLAYEMTYAGDDVVVLVNRSDTAHAIGGLPAGAWTDQLGGGAVSGSATVGPRSSMVLTK